MSLSQIIKELNKWHQNSKASISFPSVDFAMIVYSGDSFNPHIKLLMNTFRNDIFSKNEELLCTYLLEKIHPILRKYEWHNIKGAVPSILIEFGNTNLYIYEKDKYDDVYNLTKKYQYNV